MKQLLIIDGNALLHRAYHALPDFKSKEGVPTNAVYGFATMLHRVIQDFHPSHVAVCFDTKEPTFRDEMYEEYRAHRPEPDKELVNQFPIARDFLTSAGIKYYEKDGFEADDVIATLTSSVRSDDFSVVILTGDKDIFQLVDEKVSVLTPGIGYSKSTLYDREGVIKKFGLPPEKIADYKALVGDPSDNYKGVRGIGPKTAVQLIKTYGSIDEMYKHIDEIESEKIKTLLKNEKKNATISKKLAVLKEDVKGLNFSVEETSFSDYNEKLKDFFTEYQFSSLKKRFFNEKSRNADKTDDEKAGSQMNLF